MAVNKSNKSNNSDNFNSNSLNKGRIVSIRGPVLDIEFAPGKLPDTYTAVEVYRPK